MMEFLSHLSTRELAETLQAEPRLDAPRALLEATDLPATALVKEKEAAIADIVGVLGRRAGVKCAVVIHSLPGFVRLGSDFIEPVK